MNLKDEKRSRYLIDNLWVPTRRVGHDTIDPKNAHGDVVGPPARHAVSPFGDLTIDEQKMIRSGATLKEVLFMRLLDERGTPFFGNK